MTVSPIRSGLFCRCGQCGEGKLFSSYLKFHNACPACGRDLTGADTGDGPAFFVSFGVLIFMAPFLFLLPMLDLPLAVKIIGGFLLASAVIGLTLGLLPPVKAVLLNLQLHHKAEQAKFEPAPDDPS